MKKAKIVLILLLIALMSLLCTKSYGKYVLEQEQVAINLDIDRTKPIGSVNYSITEPTSENVVVTINLSEKVQDIPSWEKQGDGLIITKTYDKNANENIKLVDLSGNENSVNVNVQNIDKQSPVIKLIDVQNTKTEYKNYLNNVNTLARNVKAKVQIDDKNILQEIDESKINILIGDIESSCTKKIENVNLTETGLTFDLMLTDITELGKLKIEFQKGLNIDKASNESAQAVFDTELSIN